MDRKMYPVEGVCAEYNSCVYMADTDAMIVKYYDYQGFKRGLAIYKNFSKKLLRNYNSFGDLLGYKLNTSIPPDFILKNDSNGSNWAIGSIASSSNGRWALVEVLEKGIVMIDTRDLTVRKISDNHSRYNFGWNPRFSMDITNDGKWAVIAGLNIEPELLELSDACGAIVRPETNIGDALTEPCLTLQMRDGSSSFTQNMRDIYDPTFSDDGGELRFFATSYTDTARGKRVIVRAAGYSPQRLDYLALGDSYSSGEGDTEKDSNGEKYYRRYTDVEENKDLNIPREKCHLSTRSYPYRLAAGMNLGEAKDNASTRWQSIACGGAKIYEINDDDISFYDGQGKGAEMLWSDGGYPRLKDFENKAELRFQALNEFIPGRKKQIEFVKKYKPKVITLTIGGNDVDFGGIISKCLNPLTSCSEASQSGRSKVGSDIKKQFKDLVALYHELQKASPDVKIYVLGYPQIILDRQDVSCPNNIGGLDIDERKVMVAGYWYINQVIKMAAKKAGVMYLDTSNALVGHRLCESDNVYATGVSTWGDSERQESFHPNANGNAAIANEVWEVVGGQSLLNYSSYPSSPDETINESDIPDSEYLQTASSDESDRERQTMTESRLNRGENHQLWVDQYLLKPDSSVDITLHSEPVSLGSFQVSDDGSLDSGITIPTSVPFGYHTLRLSGETYSGEPVELYQTVLVQRYRSE